MQLSGATYTQSRLPPVASDTRVAAAIDANRSMRQGNLTIRLIEYLVFWDDFSFNLLPVADIVMKLPNSSEDFQNGYVVHTCILGHIGEQCSRQACAGTSSGSLHFGFGAVCRLWRNLRVAQKFAKCGV